MPSQFLLEFSTLYSSIHGWLSLAVCSLGLILNILNVIILKRTRTESSSKTSLILVSLAISDSCTMLTYIPYAVYYYIIYSNSILLEPFPKRDNIASTIFSVIHLDLSLTFHCISIWLTVYLAFYRYIYMSKSVDSIRKRRNHNNNSQNSFKTKQKIVRYLLSKCKHTIWLICVFSIVICMPVYFYPSIKQSLYINQTQQTKENQTIGPVFIYYISSSKLDKLTDGLVYKAMFYSQALFGKILPCILLILFITLLVHSLVIWIYFYFYMCSNYL
jgi:hypothetical protein